VGSVDTHLGELVRRTIAGNTDVVRPRDATYVDRPEAVLGRGGISPDERERRGDQGTTKGDGGYGYYKRFPIQESH
jgi:hypothetical protein